MMIPKKIHYCWFGPAPLPKLVRKCMQTWREVMPDYEICLWNEENSPMNHPFVKQAYAAKKYAFVADYVRFWALHNYGGVYLDTDMYVLRRFDDLLDANFFCGWETPMTPSGDNGGASVPNIISCGALGACALGACALGEVTEAILKHYDGLTFDAKDLNPYIVPRIITPILWERKKDITIYPYDYFYPFPFEEREKRNFLDYKTVNTYAIHLWDLSWGTWHDKLMRRVVKLYKKFKRVVYLQK